MPKFDERFARQYRYEPPPEFPLDSPCSDIVHHLSGPNKCAQLKPLSEDRGRSTVLISRQILSFRIQVWHPHTRTCVWTPWSVFQDGSYDALQASVTRSSGKPAQLGEQLPACRRPNTSTAPNQRKNSPALPIRGWSPLGADSRRSRRPGSPPPTN